MIQLRNIDIGPFKILLADCWIPVNLKKEKGRYDVEVRDEEPKEEFHQFMVNSISSFDAEVICREFKEINPNASCE